jgi:hypothetical protein
MRVRPLPFLLVLVTASALAAPVPDWVRESDTLAQPMLRITAQFSPESAARLGVEGVDDKVVDLGPGYSERHRAATEAVIKDLKAKLPATKDPRVRQDIQILIDTGRRQNDVSKLEDALLLPFFTPSRTAFSGIFPARPTDPEGAAGCGAGAAAAVRGGAGSTPITELAKARTVEQLGNRNLLGPFKPEVEQALADSKRLVAGIGELFKKWGLSGYEQPLAKLGEQMDAYDSWVKAEILPRSRTDSRLPPELYAVYLRTFGVNTPPEEVLRRALVTFAELRNEMNALAPLVARAQKLPAGGDYRSVLRALKKKQLTNASLMPLYAKRLASLEEIARREHVVTLPERKAVIRLGSEAESALQPAPHMNPPRLIGNTGEYGEFVLPLATPGAPGQKNNRTHDFTKDAATRTHTLHQAAGARAAVLADDRAGRVDRPGHLREQRQREGWALYAEAEMKPYLPLDGQLVSLQHRLLRAARAFSTRR